MLLRKKRRKLHLNLTQRLSLLGIYIVALEVLSGIITGRWLPQSGGEGLWFISAVGLLFFTRLTSPFFIKPRDAVSRGGTAALLLATLNLESIGSLSTPLNNFRWVACILAAVTAFVGVIAIPLDKKDPVTEPRLAFLGKVTFRLSDRLGRGAILFTPPALISIFGFHRDETIQFWLVFIWSILIFIQPAEVFVHIVQDLLDLKRSNLKTKAIGQIQRIDDPGIIRVKLTDSRTWKTENLHLACLPDSRQIEVLPLFVQVQNAELIGTGLLNVQKSESTWEVIPGNVYPVEHRKASTALEDLYGKPDAPELVGFIVEQSSIGKIRFEV